MVAGGEIRARFSQAPGISGVGKERSGGDEGVIGDPPEIEDPEADRWMALNPRPDSHSKVETFFEYCITSKPPICIRHEQWQPNLLGYMHTPCIPESE